MKKFLNLILLLALSGSLAAQPLYVADNAFGSGGQISLNVNNGDDGSSTVLVRPDGKILLCGYSRLGATSQFLVFARYNPTGIIDQTFGQAGTITYSVGNSAIGQMRTLSDGSIICHGNALVQQRRRFFLLKLKENGRRDSSFASNGSFVYISPDDRTYSQGGMEMQADGKFIGVGSQSDSLIVIRVTADGRLDSTFGQNGVFMSRFGFLRAGGYDLKILNDGKLVVCGQVQNDPISIVQDLLVTRLMPNGTVDPTFGTNGKTVLAYEAVQSEELDELYLQPDGKILLSGQSQEFGQSREPAMVRVLANGTVDAGFATAGRYKRDGAIGSMSVENVDSNGNIRAIQFLFSQGTVVGLYGYLPNGQPDLSFGSNGLEGIGLGTSFTGWRSAYRNADRSVVVAGHKQNTGASGNDIVVKRYIINPASVRPSLSSTLTFSPNPATTSLELAWKQSLQNNADALLLDACGRTVKTYPFKKGATAASISLAGVKPGLYTVHCPGLGIARIAVE